MRPANAPSSILPEQARPAAEIKVSAARASPKPPAVKRNKHARVPVAVRAAFVSQENCRELLGVDPRRYLELLVPLCRGDVTRLGKLRLIPLDVAEGRIGALAASGDDADDEDDEPDHLPPQLETVDAVLAAIGRRRTG